MRLKMAGFRMAGVKSELIVYDAMSHAFWYMIGTPESREALEAMAEFF